MSSLKSKLKSHFTSEVIGAIIEKNSCGDLFVDYYNLIGVIEAEILDVSYNALGKRKAWVARHLNLNRTTLVMKIKKYLEVS